MQDFILIPIPLDKLKTEISEAVKKELQALLATYPQAQNQTPDLITRKEAAKVLGVSLPTLNEWTKEGRIIGYRISSRVRYKRTELEAALTQIKTARVA